MIHLVCRKEDLVTVPAADVRWLAVDRDYELARTYWADLGQVLARSTWESAHAYGYSYAALIAAGRVISSAAVWRFSGTDWDVAAVSTLPAWRRRGHSRQVISFVCAYIHASGRTAVCCTAESNQAMLAAAQRVGFSIVPPGTVWWSYPDLPEF